jgi:PPOX class probable F420-dependent enzyme
MKENSRDHLNNHQYINVETFRKNGVGVKTPLWFAQDDDRLVVWTESASGKLKRIRNNPQVRLAACDTRGKLLGAWADAQAEIITDDNEKKRIDHLVTKIWADETFHGYF